MRLWLLTDDPATSQAGIYPRSGGRVLNGAEVFEASAAFNASLLGDGPWSDPWPPDFPRPRVRFAEGRLPDYNVVQNMPFISDRMRRAMALPEHDAQLLSVRNVSRPPRARSARYSLLHVLAHARAIDGERSDCHVDRPVSAKTGEQVLRFTGLTGIRFLSGLEPPADLFRETAAPMVVLATDALAERVIAAGCTGVQFRHPLWFAPGFDEVIRTRDGAARLVWDASGRRYDLESMSLEEADAAPRSRPDQRAG